MPYRETPNDLKTCHVVEPAKPRSRLQAGSAVAAILFGIGLIAAVTTLLSPLLEPSNQTLSQLFHGAAERFGSPQ